MNKLYHGDCLEIMPTIPDRSVDMILCDLPYGTLDLDWDKRIDSERLFEEYKRICKCNANVLLFCQIKFAKELMNATLKHELSHCLVWEKGNSTRRMSAKSAPLSRYELILVFRINKAANEKEHASVRKYLTEELLKSGYTVDQLKELIPNKGAHHWFLRGGDFRAPTQHGYKRLQEITGCFPRPWEDVWEEFQSGKNNFCTYNPEHMKSDIVFGELHEKRVHPTQKPVSLLRQLIQAYSNEGETILDNCMGSGSTGVACVNLKRDFIGIEKEEKYFKIAEQRIKEAEAEREYSLFKE